MIYFKCPHCGQLIEDHGERCFDLEDSRCPHCDTVLVVITSDQYMAEKAVHDIEVLEKQRGQLSLKLDDLENKRIDILNEMFAIGNLIDKIKSNNGLK